jgi:hypothetical protein
MQKKMLRKMSLSRETLRLLDGARLKEAAGGMTLTTCTNDSTPCNSEGCQTYSCPILTACNC